MNRELTNEYIDYLRLLSKSYPTIQKAAAEVINLQAIMNLPKGTEHFLSDIHGSYEPFVHLLKSGSGVIKDKIDENFPILSEEERKTLCTIIYYPKEKLSYLRSQGKLTNEFYEKTLSCLIDIAKITASKYTKSKVRKAMNPEFAYSIEELMQSHDFILNKENYYKAIIKSIIETGRAEAYIKEMAKLIQRLSVDHLHILGDIFDRGAKSYLTMEHICNLPSVDITWGNHDIVYMGAAAGNKTCVASVIRACCKYNTLATLEDGYGIPLRPLIVFALKTYKNDPCSRFMPDDTELLDDNDAAIIAKMHKAITIIMFKLESQLIHAHPNYGAESILKFEKINFENMTINLKGKTYELLDKNFPTVDPKDPTKLTLDEEELIEKLTQAFRHCDKLQKHVDFLFSHGSMYLTYNSNLLYHGCIPTDENGEFVKFESDSHNFFSGKALLDYCERKVRKGYYAKRNDPKRQEAVDFFYYLWCGKSSPLFGKDEITTFERYFLDKNDKKLLEEKKNAYFKYQTKPEYCNKIFKEFGLSTKKSVIINGHMPVKIRKGETPIKANGKLIIIDGGICKAYQKVTGIAGYTLVFNSYGMKLIAHQPFLSKDEAIYHNEDVVHSITRLNEDAKQILVKETDKGKTIQKQIDELLDLLKCYQEGIIKAK